MSKKLKKKVSTDPPEQVTADEALKRMKGFVERKEKLVAAVKKSKD
jgi:hypothetical protein